MSLCVQAASTSYLQVKHVMYSCISARSTYVMHNYVYRGIFYSMQWRLNQTVMLGKCTYTWTLKNNFDTYMYNSNILKWLLKIQYNYGMWYQLNYKLYWMCLGEGGGHTNVAGPSPKSTTDWLVNFKCTTRSKLWTW